jgi:hypothetical protein
MDLKKVKNQKNLIDEFFATIFFRSVQRRVKYFPKADDVCPIEAQIGKIFVFLVSPVMHSKSFL